jgi:serine/threonine-protein kinase HipA
MISNKDNHLRNHGFLYTGAGWALSPAYDLNPNIEKSNFAVAIDDTGAQNTIPLALKVTENFRLSGQRVKEILEEVKTAVAGWRRVAKSFGISENHAEQMKSAFAVD